MPICGYVVLSEPGAAPALSARLASLPGCEVVRAENRDLLLLVTEASDRREDTALRERVEATDGVAALILTFGDVDPNDEGPGGSRPRPAPRGA